MSECIKNISVETTVFSSNSATDLNIRTDRMITYA